MAETTTTFCRICESLCGLEVEREGGRVTAVRPDRAHVATEGFACPKGLRQHEIYASPDRLRYPLRRVGDRYERATWEEAYADIGAKVRRLRTERHPDSIAMYVGTAAGFSLLHPIFAQGFMQGVGSRSLYSSATQDCASKFAVARDMYGFPFTQPFPDVDRCGCLVVVGANPVISKWSFSQVPNPGGRLRERVRDGMALWIVDPRATETVRVTGGRHVPIRPDADLFFYLAFLHELLATGGVDAERVAATTVGAEVLPELVAAWPPERCAEVTGIPAERLREIVRTYREADGAALYLSTGVNMGTQGALCFWLQEVINAVSGNLDRAGGTLVGRGVVDFASFAVSNGLLVSDARSRVGNHRAVNDAFPGAVLADEILTPGERQVRALFVTGGNPLLTMADSGRLRDAFEQLELLVCVDILLNETASLAHWVLPATSPLERPDLPFAFPFLLGMQRKPYLQATRAVVEPDGEQRDEATIYHDLARASGVGLFGSRVASGVIEAARKARRWAGGGDGVPQERVLDLLLRLGGEGGFAALLDAEHGRLRAEHVAGSFLGERVQTGDGKVQLAPAVLVEALAVRAEAAFAREQALVGTLKLITRRSVETHNSWTHNHAGFVAGQKAENHLYVHPDDAAARGLEDGAFADVQSATARVRVRVRLLAELSPGTVALPHGWGHQAARGLTVAARTAGVNVNLLAASGPDAVDPLSGMAHLTGIPVDVRPAAGPRDPTDWTGLPPEERDRPLAGPIPGGAAPPVR